MNFTRFHEFRNGITRAFARLTPAQSAAAKTVAKIDHQPDEQPNHKTPPRYRGQFTH
jgi:hypothetical protein